MKKIVSFILGGVFIMQFVLPVFGASSDGDALSTLQFPDTPEFVSLKNILKSKFSSVESGTKSVYSYNCILSGKLCPNYKYTSIDEKALKLILLKTYTGNEGLYNRLFATSYPSHYDFSESSGGSSLTTLLSHIPRGASSGVYNQNSYISSSVGSELIDASFGVNFSSQNSSSMLSAIEQKIKDMKRNKCTRISAGTNTSITCPWNGDISNMYLPTPEELFAETIFLNGNSVKISSLKDEIEYALQMGPPVTQTGTMNPISNNRRAVYKGYMNGRMFIMTQDITLAYARENCNINTQNNLGSSVYCTWDEKDINSYPLDVSYTTTTTVPNILGYTLRYKKEYYTLSEAKDLIDKKPDQDMQGVYTSGPTPTGLPCNVPGSSISSSECTQTLTDLRSVIYALGAYYADREQYPDTVDLLTNIYIPKQEILTRFKQNFSYRPTSQGQMPDYEIRYIRDVTIGTGSTTSNKKDYTLMLSGMVIPEIPQVFSYVPADSMVLYLKNPANLTSLLEYRNTDKNDILLDTHKSIQNFVLSYFGIDDIEQLKAHLTHELAIVVSNMDTTAPDIVLVLSEADKGALSPTATTQVAGTKDGYVFVATSKASLERVMNLTQKESLKEAPDFHYVWAKKSGSIQDAFVFVGDAFFEKMLTFENYILHARKYTDYKNLRSLQELVWAYKEAFGELPQSFSDISVLGRESLTGSILDSYTLQGDMVQHKNIGTLKSLNTLNDSNYDLSHITRAEIDTYKYNILKYREVWRASLDPMGIVLNRYGDGIDIDFFMTPIPELGDSDMTELRDFFEGTTKDSLSFVTDNRVRMGLLSLVGGFDINKIQKKILTNPDIAEGFADFSKEVLDGKNIFDYIRGEFAFTLGDIDADILDGWNVDKVDMYLSVQVASEEKGKELVEAIRMNMLEKTNGGESSELDMAKGFFAKPLIEEYAGKKIYYIDGAAVPYVGKLGIAYTFVNDFFYIGLNRQTIKHIIDIASTGDSRKEDIVDTDAVQKNSFFAILFDGVETSNTIKALYEKNQKNIPRYLNSLGLGLGARNSQIEKLIGTYYATQDMNKRLGKKVIPMDFTVGGLTVSGDAENPMARMDEGVLASLSGQVLEDWNTLRTGSGFQSVLLTDTGMPLEQFLDMQGADTVLTTNLAASLQNKLDSGESLLKNSVFSLSMGDDEIGFKIRIFEKKGDSGKEDTLGGISIIAKDIPQDILVIIIIFSVLSTVGIISYIFYKRQQSMGVVSSDGLAPTSSMVVPSPMNPIGSPTPPTGTRDNL